MSEIVATLVVMLLIVICIYVIYCLDKRLKKTVDDVIRKAYCLSADMDAIECYLVEIREQLNKLSKTLDEIERDVE